MEIIQGHVTLKQIFEQHWDAFLDAHPELVTAYMAYNI